MFISQTDINYNVVLLRCLFWRLTHPEKSYFSFMADVNLFLSHAACTCQIIYPPKYSLIQRVDLFLSFLIVTFLFSSIMYSVDTFFFFFFLIRTEFKPMALALLAIQRMHFQVKIPKLPFWFVIKQDAFTRGATLYNTTCFS